MEMKKVTISDGSSPRYTGHILAIDDDPSLLAMIGEALASDGHEVELVDNASEALKRIQDTLYDILLVDLIMPDMNGIALLKEAKKIQPDSEVIIITGFGDIQSAVQAIKEGAYNYITKPFQIEKFLIDIQKALEKKYLQENIDALKRRVEGDSSFGEIIGSSPSMMKVFSLIRQVAQTECTVLILGESGTGKELVAREIHRRSKRCDGPFIAVSCGSLPQSLLESELFGHMKGAFTGALNTKMGLFEAANRGTIFLDEIGTANMQTQVGLLRVLQNREIRKVGSPTSKKVDVRVLAATNIDLKQAIERSEFREDLYYRLNSVNILVPPLRERVDDIIPLAKHFLSCFCGKQNKKERSFSPKVVETLMNYHWPGNVRQLENVIENAVTFSEREIIRPKDLPGEVMSDGIGERAEHLPALEEMEEEHIRRALMHTAGNKQLAAKLLRIPRATLYRKLQKYSIQ